MIPARGEYFWAIRLGREEGGFLKWDEMLGQYHHGEVLTVSQALHPVHLQDPGRTWDPGERDNDSLWELLKLPEMAG